MRTLFTWVILNTKQGFTKWTMLEKWCTWLSEWAHCQPIPVAHRLIDVNRCRCFYTETVCSCDWVRWKIAFIELSCALKSALKCIYESHTLTAESLRVAIQGPDLLRLEDPKHPQKTNVIQYQIYICGKKIRSFWFPFMELYEK